MRRLLILTVACLLIAGCDIPGRLTIKNRMDKSVGIAMSKEFKGRMPFSDTSSYVVIAPKENVYINYGWGWRWKKKDEARVYRYIENNTTVMGDSLDVPRLRIGLHRERLLGKRMVVRLR